MKKYKKALFTTMILSAFPVSLWAASSDTPIKVTTFDDEDGENMHACSLREALKTAEIRKNYGGCEVTDILSTTLKTIQLEAGTYHLDRELTPNTNVAIYGASPEDWEHKNVLIGDIVNQYPAQTALKTTIKANGSRIFNTTNGKKALSLYNVALTGGKSSDRGGAIYAGADIHLQQVSITNAQAAEGGAIFLAGPTANLTISKSLIQQNQASIGAVLAMSCFNDAVYSKRSVNITGSSLIGNGSSQANSIFEFCGEPNAIFSTNTIARNIVNSAIGNVLKFSGDAIPNDPNSNSSSILSRASRLNLENNTIVENQGYTTFLYDQMGTKRLSFNILAYNYNGNEKSYACRYLLGNAKEQENMDLGVSYNAIALTGNNQCDIPDQVLERNETNIDVSNISFSSLLSPLQPASAYTAFLPLYYPKDNKTENDLVDIGVTGCSAKDQRGLNRITDGTLYYSPDERNSCDIGSVELMRLTAGDLQNLSNQSLSALMDNYQEQYDFFDNLVKNPNNPDYVTYYKSRVAQYKNLLEKTKANYKYRAIYVDLANYQLPLPEEIEQADGTHQLQFLDSSHYDVTVEALGVGQFDGEELSIPQPDPNLVCQWNADLQQIVIHRKDDVITQAGDKVFCKYTIHSKTDPNIKSSGLISAAFQNIEPVAKNTSVTFKYQKKQTITLNLLDFANDDGDTGENGINPEKKPNKPRFWKNEDGIELPIRLMKVPTKDLNITADRQGACPKPDEKETCYGGNIYIQEVNAFNPFNFDFQYQVYDADGKASNIATVRTINTATTTDDTRRAGGGGGSINIYTLLGLLGLFVYRRFR